jgi:outer membrane protein assembly factor BamE (lipoprotein component of BamABCDE complex)
MGRRDRHTIVCTGGGSNPPSTSVSGIRHLFSSTNSPTQKSGRQFLLLVWLMLSAVPLASCSWLAPPPVARGNKVETELLKELVPGTSTKADVTALIGSPTAHDSFDDNTWLYISELTQQRIGRTLGEVSQDVVVLGFDQTGVLRTVSMKTMDDSLPVSVVARTTPSPGTEASFIQQLLGNIGRFNPTGGAAPGGGGGAPTSSGLGP